jgi:hypothetical protein
VSTRYANHWAQRITDANPRGHTESMLQRISQAPTLIEKMNLELDVMCSRRTTQKCSGNPVDDGYGMARIDAMEAEIRTEYAARAAGVAPQPHAPAHP